MSYAFFDATGRVVSTGARPRYRLTRRDAGRAIACRVTATSPGGTAVLFGAAAVSGALPAGPLGSRLVVQTAPVSVRGGRRAFARVTLSGVRGRTGTVRACVAAVPRTAARSLPMTVVPPR